MPDKLIEVIRNNNEGLKERVRWAITYVADNHGMSNEKLAKYLGYATSTINSYRRKITIPGLDFFVLFLYKYMFNLDWFVKGTGEPFPGARSKYPEVCGPEYARRSADPEDVTESPPLYTNRIPIADDLTKTARILESPTPYATALHLNINSFHRALETEEKSNDILSRFEDLQKQLDEVRSRNNELSREIIILRGQLLGGADTSSETG